MNNFDNNNPFSNRFPSANPMQPASENSKLFTSRPAITKKELIKKQKAQARFTPQIELPYHSYVPLGAESIDARRVMNIPSPTVLYQIFRFQAPPGSVTRFIAYGVYNDGDDAANYELRPLLDGARIFRYHGDPLNHFEIDLGLGPDLSANAMIPCQLVLQPGQVLEWLVTNTSGVDTSMGVRMRGYFDTQQQRSTPMFG